MSLERTVSIDGKDVVISQQIVLKKPYITKQEFKSAPFKKLQEDTKACFYRAGVLIEANTNKS
jgi:poly-beta-hydroxyalkanoate depolymerase